MVNNSPTMDPDVEKGNHRSTRQPDEKDTNPDFEDSSETTIINGDHAGDSRPTQEEDQSEKSQPADNPLAPAPTHDPLYEVSFEGLSDPINPRGRYTHWQKWMFVLLCSSTSLCVTCVSSLYTMTYQQLEAEFGCSEEIATLGLSLFVAGLGLGPMVLAPLSEVS